MADSERISLDQAMMAEAIRLDGGDVTGEDFSRGAPAEPGSAPGAAPPVPDVPNAVLVAQLVSVIGAVAAARWGDHWTFTDSECDTLGAAIDQVLDKYLPGMTLGVEVTLILTAGMIVHPKLMKHMELARGAISESEKEKPTSPVPGSDRHGQDHRPETEPAAQKNPAHPMGPGDGSPEQVPGVDDATIAAAADRAESDI